MSSSRPQTQLRVDNVYTSIEGPFDRTAVKKVLTIKDKSIHFRRTRNRFAKAHDIFLLEEGDRFLTGLLERVKPALDTPFNEIDPRIQTGPDGTLKEYVPFFTLRDYQQESVDAMMHYGRGVIWLPTAGGKTYIAAETIRLLRQPSLYLIHSKDVMLQTYRKFCNWFGEDAVGVCGAGLFDPKPIMVATVQSAVKLDLEVYKVLICDEAHHCPMSTYLKVITACPAYWRFGLTGTPTGRSDGKDILLTAATGEVIYSREIGHLREQGFVAPFRVVVAEMRHKGIPHYLAGSYRDIEEHWLVRNIARNEMIALFAKQVAGRSTLISVRRIDHGETLSKLIPDSIFVHGSLSLAERENALKVRGKPIIATGIFDEGIDVDHFDAIINARGGKSEIALKQRIGRGLRPSEGKQLLVFDFLDKGLPLLERHSKARIRTYKDLGVEPEILSTS